MTYVCDGRRRHCKVGDIIMVIIPSISFTAMIENITVGTDKRKYLDLIVVSKKKKITNRLHLPNDILYKVRLSNDLCQ